MKTQNVYALVVRHSYTAQRDSDENTVGYFAALHPNQAFDGPFEGDLFFLHGHVFYPLVEMLQSTCAKEAKFWEFFHCVIPTELSQDDLIDNLRDSTHFNLSPRAEVTRLAWGDVAGCYTGRPMRLK